MLSTMRADIKNDKGAESKLAGLQARVLTLVKSMSDMTARADTRKLDAQILAKMAEVRKLQAQMSGLQMDADSTRAALKIAQLESQAAKLEDQLQNLAPDADVTVIEAKFNDVHAQLALLKRQASKLDLVMGNVAALRNIGIAKAELASLRKEARDIRLGVNVDPAKLLKAEADLLGLEAAAAAAGGGGGLGGLAAAFANAGGGARRFGGILGGTFAGFALWHIALDAILEAFISLATAIIAAVPAVLVFVNVAQDIATHLNAVRTITESLGQSIAPLTGKFDALARSMAPQVIEAYGGALNLAANNANAFGQVAHRVADIFDTWVAKIDIWDKASGGINAILNTGTGYLQQWGSLLGQIGIAIGNLVKSDPGIAHYLLDLISGLVKLIDWATRVAPVVVELALALHGLYLWGRVLGGVMLNAAAGLQKMAISIAGVAGPMLGVSEASGKMAGSFLGLSVVSWAWAAIAAAGLAYLVYQAGQADTATKKLAGDLNNGLGSLSASQAIPQITADIGQMNTRIAGMGQTARGAFSQMGTGWHQAESGFVNLFTALAAGNPFKMITSEARGWGTFLTGILHGLGDPVQKNAQDIAFLNAAINRMLGSQRNLFNETGVLIKQGFTYSQALALMDLAGVRAGDSFAVMRQKAANLITGYQNMSVQGSILSNSVNALTFAALQQQSKVSELNTAWDTFIATVTGSITGFAKFETQVYAMGAAATATGDTLSLSSGRAKLSLKGLESASKGASTSITGLSLHSLQLREAFTQGVTDANSLADALTLQASAAGLGAHGTDLLAAAVKDTVAQLLPMAKGSQQATTELYALAQRGGYTGADSFQALSKWMSTATGTVKAAKNPATQLDTIVTTLSGHSANLTGDVQNLSIALGTTLSGAMATAITAASGGQKNFTGFATAVLSTGVNSTATQQAAVALGDQLLAITGNAKDAKDQFEAFAIGGLHLTKQQAEGLWNLVNNNALSPKVNPAELNAFLTEIGVAPEKIQAINRLDISPSSDPRHVDALLKKLGLTKSQIDAINADILNPQVNNGPLDGFLQLLGLTPGQIDQVNGMSISPKSDLKHVDALLRKLGLTPGQIAAINSAVIRPKVSTGATDLFLYTLGLYPGQIAAINKLKISPESDQKQVDALLRKLGLTPGQIAAINSTLIHPSVSDLAVSALLAKLKLTPVQIFNINQMHISPQSDQRQVDALLKKLGLTPGQIDVINRSLIHPAVSSAGLDAFLRTLRLTPRQITAINQMKLGPGSDTKATDALLKKLGLTPGQIRAINNTIIRPQTDTHPLDEMQAKMHGVEIVAARGPSEKGWANFRHDIASIFDSLRHDIAHIWDVTWNNTVARLMRGVADSQKLTAGWEHDIAHWFDLLRHDIAHIWDVTWNNTVARLMRGVADSQKIVAGWEHNIAHWFDVLRHDISASWDSAWNSVRRTLGNAVHDIEGALTASKNWIHNNFISPVATLFTQTLPNAFRSAVSAIGRIWGNVRGAISGPVVSVMNNTLGRLFGWIDQIGRFVGLNPNLPTKFARGGQVPGSGHGDTVPAMLTPGEVVVPVGMVRRGAVDHLRGQLPGFASGGLVNPIGRGLRPERIDMGVDYGGFGALYALGAGRITGTDNSGWPGGTFIDLRLNPPYGSGYWYYAEDIQPAVRAGQGVSAGQLLGHAYGGPSGIEVGWASGRGGQTMAAAAGQQSHSGDPGSVSTAWGKAASDLIGSLGGPRGILQGAISGGTSGIGFIVRTLQDIFSGLGNMAKIAIDLAHGDAGGAGRALGALLPKGAGGAKGMLASVLTRIPGKLISEAMSFLAGKVKGFADSQQSFSSGALGGDAGANKALARKLFPFPAAQWPDFDYLEMREAGYNRFARNPSSGAYGIPQALPESKLPFAGQSGGGSHAGPQLSWMYGYIKCMPISNTEILTRDGWKRYENVQVGDETIGYNPETGCSEWTPVTRINVYGNAPVVRLRNKTWEAECTPNHRWVTRHVRQTENRTMINGVRVPAPSTSYHVDTFTPADQLTSRHSIRLAADADTGEGPSISPGEAELLGWVMGDGSVSGYGTRKDTGTPLAVAISQAAAENPGASYREIGRLAGCTHQTAAAYLRGIGAGGCGQYWRTGSGSMRRIILNQAKPGGVETIDAILAAEGILSSRHEYPAQGIARLPRVTWALTAAYTDELLKRSGYDHQDPVSFVLSLSEAQREAFLRGVFGAEGHQEPAKIFDGRGPYLPARIYSQADGPQQDAIVLALYLSGHRPAIRDWSTASRARFSSKPGANIGETKPFISGAHTKQEDAGQADVWCPTTKLGSWTARQDRNVFLTGNSRYGDAAAAAAHERSAGWYGQGGLVPGMAAGGPVGMAAGGDPMAAVVKQIRANAKAEANSAAALARFRQQLGAAEAGEHLKFFGLEHSFGIGPAKYRTKTVMSELGTLAKRQQAELAAYGKLSGKGLTKANLSRLGSAARAVQRTAGDKALSHMPGGHPLFARDLSRYLGTISALSGQAVPTGTGGPVAQLTGTGALFAQFLKDRSGTFAVSSGPAQEYLYKAGQSAGKLVPQVADRGTVLAPGMNLRWNGLGRPEPLVPPGSSSAGGSGEVHVHLHVHGPVGSQVELEAWLLKSVRSIVRTRGGGIAQQALGRHEPKGW